MEAVQTPVVAIDGPSGSGKSTITQLVAKKLGLIYLDTGAMFRAVAYFLDSKGIDPSEVEKIEKQLEQFTFTYGKSPDVLVEIDDEDLTHKIREHHVSALASKYSQIPVVRTYLKKLQRDIGCKKPSILEGRDIGTVIFPKAALKIFLTANDEVRAKRRLDQLQGADPSVEISLEQVLQDIRSRDEQDQARAMAPLVKADDAVELDTSSLSIEAVVEQICDLYKQREELFS